MLKKILIAGMISYSALSTAFAKDLACADDYAKIIAPDLKKMATELSSNNYSFVREKTHHSLIEYSGGEENFLRLLDLTKGLLKQSNTEILNVETKPPLYSYKVGEEEVCFVPKVTTLKIQGKTTQTPPSFMLAVRELDQHEWTYLEGANLEKNPQMLYVLFPNFPKNVKLPFNTKTSK